jgi:tight adherence protein B
METLPVILALVAAGSVLFFLASVRSILSGRNDRLRERVEKLADDTPAATSLLFRPQKGGLARLGDSLAFMRRLEELRKRAKTESSPQVIVAKCLGLAVVGWFAASFTPVSMLAPLVAVLFGMAPVVLLRRKAARRMARFQKQLPDALDLMARALLAGHAFSGSLRMIAEECDPPIGPEFGKVLEEINFGASTEQALANLLQRVDCPDLKFFVVSVNIQRETGGNLTEIVTSIARLIRERYKLFGKVKTLSAEGKLSAIILVCLPFAIGGIIYVLNSGYISLLWQTQLGKLMLAGAGVSMFMGMIWIRRLVSIKV